jgi:hypothetical protein
LKVFQDRKMIIMKDFSLVFSSLEVAETSAVVALLRRGSLGTPQGLGESGFAELTFNLNLEDEIENKGVSVKGSRAVSPVVYILMSPKSDWASPGAFVKTRLVMLRGRNRTQMLLFIKDIDDEERVFDALDKARKWFHPELDRLGDVLVPSKGASKDDVLRKAFLYVNETNRVVLASQPFVQSLAKCTRSSLLSKAQLPKDASRALDVCRELLKILDSDSSTVICSEGNWTISAKRSGTRYLFRFALSSNSLAFASQDAFHSLTLEASQLEAIIKEHFSSFVIL